MYIICLTLIREFLGPSPGALKKKYKNIACDIRVLSKKIDVIGIICADSGATVSITAISGQNIYSPQPYTNDATLRSGIFPSDFFIGLESHLASRNLKTGLS